MREVYYMVVPWRDARLDYYGGHQLFDVVNCGGLSMFIYHEGQIGVGLVMQPCEIPFSRGEIELYVAAPDFMSGKPYHSDRSLPLIVPHNSIYGIGTTNGGAMLDALKDIPTGSTLHDLIRVLFSEHPR